MMEKQYSAGGILLNKNNQVYVLHNTKRNEWVLPKGKIEGQETAIQTAIREIHEETGFFEITEMLEIPIYISHYQFKQENTETSYDKFVTYFLLKTEKILPEETKEMKEEGLVREWFTMEDAILKVSHEDSKKILKIANEIINESKFSLVLLGGNSLKNLDWINKASDYFKQNFPSNKILYYQHWTNSNLEMDLNLEAKKLVKISKDSQNLTVFAKSAGIMTTLIAMKDYGLKPQKCVFVGFPSNVLDDWGINYLPYLKEVNIQTTLFQNSEDPMGTYEKTKEIFEKNQINNINLILEEGNTHDYNTFDKYLVKLLS